MTSLPDVLWTPPEDVRSSSAIGRFLAFVEQRRGLSFADYEAAWEWSVDQLDEFWADLWEFFDVRTSQPCERVVSDGVLPDVRWFEGARLNYAEHALRMTGDDIAVIARSQSRQRIELTWDELRAQVGAARAGLLRAGVGVGDRVAAYLPNVPEAIVVFLATASLGAIFTTCAPEFGVQAVLDRFGQVEPKVLFVVDGYRYGSKTIDRSAEVAAIRDGLPTVSTVVSLGYLDPLSQAPAGATGWAEFVAEPGELVFEQVAADHPLYVLYSSGTTGLPKAIIHGHGGILSVHLKDVGLMSDIGPGDRFFWFSTTGWMMWNFLVSGLVVGSTVVLFDGDLASPDLMTLWRLADEERVTWFGASAPFYMACRKAGLEPGTELDLSAIRVVGSTGAPLPVEGFQWIYEAVGESLMLSSISGGTDICSAFVGGSPMVPVWAGEISTRFLGCAVAAFDETGRSVVGEQGELVITAPLPSMPVGFWNDPDGSKYRAAYFDAYPGVWRHGDWITITERGSCVITGRSDATLNRSGVRIGTSEIYRVTDSIPGVADSLIVHLEDPSGTGPGELILFVALTPAPAPSPAPAPAPSPAPVLTFGSGVPAVSDTGSRDAGTVRPLSDTGPVALEVGLSAALVRLIRTEIRSALSPRHVPDVIYEVPSIPTTLSGKKLELPVKKILRGADPDDVASRGAIRDPTALDAVAAIAASRSRAAG